MFPHPRVLIFTWALRGGGDQPFIYLFLNRYFAVMKFNTVFQKSFFSSYKQCKFDLNLRTQTLLLHCIYQYSFLIHCRNMNQSLHLSNVIVIVRNHLMLLSFPSFPTFLSCAWGTSCSCFPTFTVRTTFDLLTTELRIIFSIPSAVS